MSQIPTPDNLDIQVEIDLNMLVQRMMSDPKALKKITDAVRAQLLKDARSKGNIFGPWGSGKL